MLRPVGFPNRRPLADTLEIFKADSAFGVFGFRDQALGDDMVGVTPEQRFFATDPAKMGTGRSRASRLQILAKLMVAASRVFNRFTGKPVSVGIGSDVDDAQVHTNKSLRIDGRLFGRLDDQQKIEDVANQNQIGKKHGLDLSRL